MPISIGRHFLSISISSIKEVLNLSKSRSIYRDFPHVSQLLEKRFFRRRKEKKLSQTALANKTGLTRNCIQQLECHEHLPLPSTMLKLLKALDFSSEEAAEFWVELDAAFDLDNRSRESRTENIRGGYDG